MKGDEQAISCHAVWRDDFSSRRSIAQTGANFQEYEPFLPQMLSNKYTSSRFNLRLSTCKQNNGDSSIWRHAMVQF